MTEFLTGLIENPINAALLALVIVALFVVYKLQRRRNLGSGKGDAKPGEAIPGNPQVDSAQAQALAYVAQVQSQGFGPQAPGLAGQAPPLSPKEAKALAKKEEEARKAAAKAEAKAKKEADKAAEKAAMEEAKRLKAELKKNKGKAKTAAPEAIQAAPAADDPTEILPDNAVQQGIIEAARLEEPTLAGPAQEARALWQGASQVAQGVTELPAVPQSALTAVDIAGFDPKAPPLAPPPQRQPQQPALAVPVPPPAPRMDLAMAAEPEGEPAAGPLAQRTPQVRAVGLRAATGIGTKTAAALPPEPAVPLAAAGPTPQLSVRTRPGRAGGPEIAGETQMATPIQIDQTQLPRAAPDAPQPKKSVTIQDLDVNYEKLPFMTPLEIVYYKLLRGALRQYLIFPRVSSGAVVRAQSPDKEHKKIADNILAGTSLSFIVCDVRLNVRAVVEVVDENEAPTNKEKARDYILKKAGCVLVRFYSGDKPPDPETLRMRVIGSI